jgi:hypothetical protein
MEKSDPQPPTSGHQLDSATSNSPSSQDRAKNAPLRKRSRISAELVGERRQSSRVKDKSKPDLPQDARIVSLSCFLQKWDSALPSPCAPPARKGRSMMASDMLTSHFRPHRTPIQEWWSSRVQNDGERGATRSCERAYRGVTTCEATSSNARVSARRGDRGRTRIRTTVRVGGLVFLSCMRLALTSLRSIRSFRYGAGDNNRGVVELMRMCLVRACLDLPHTVPWNAQIKVRITCRCTFLVQ